MTHDPLAGDEVSFFGSFYRRTTRPFLSEGVTRAEATFIAGQLPVGKALDLGCGEGRHLRALAGRGGLLGVDFDSEALAVASAFAPVACGDLRNLPFRSGAFSGVYCWYSTLFVFEEAGNLAALAEAARVLARSGRFVFQTVNPLQLAAHPDVAFEQVLPDGARLRERSHFDAAEGIDHGVRSLEAPGEPPCHARYALRYYQPHELKERFEAAGLRIQRLFGSVLGEPFHDGSPDLVVLAERG